MSALSLLSNAVRVWNTVRIAKIVRDLERSVDRPVRPEVLGRVSPLWSGHVIASGTYHFVDGPEQVEATGREDRCGHLLPIRVVSGSRPLSFRADASRSCGSTSRLGYPGALAAAVRRFGGLAPSARFYGFPPARRPNPVKNRTTAGRRKTYSGPGAHLAARRSAPAPQSRRPAAAGTYHFDRAAPDRRARAQGNP